MVDLVSHLAQPELVAGLTWRRPNGEVIANRRRENPPDLDTRPWPLRSECFPSYLGKPIASLLSSRGCYSNCHFCSINAWHKFNGGKRFRQRDVGALADEMASLYHEHGIRLFNFQDDNFLVHV